MRRTDNKGDFFPRIRERLQFFRELLARQLLPFDRERDYVALASAQNIVTASLQKRTVRGNHRMYAKGFGVCDHLAKIVVVDPDGSRFLGKKACRGHTGERVCLT